MWNNDDKQKPNHSRLPDLHVHTVSQLRVGVGFVVHVPVHITMMIQRDPHELLYMYVIITSAVHPTFSPRKRG